MSSTDGRVTAAVIADFALRKREDMERMAARVIADAAADRGYGIKGSPVPTNGMPIYQAYGVVDRGQATDAPSRVAPLTGLRFVAPFGGAQRPLKNTLDSIPTEVYRAAYVAWRTAVENDIPITSGMIANVLGVSEPAAAQQIRAWVETLGQIARGETYEPMKGDRTPGANATPEYAEAWKVIAPYVGTDRWEATIIGMIKRIAENDRGRRPDFSIGPDCGQSAIEKAAERIADLLSRNVPEVVLTFTASDLDFIADGVLSTYGPECESCTHVECVTRRIVLASEGSAYRTALTQITRHVQRARDASEDVPTAGGIAAWGIARWARCGECERCEDAANGGRSRWLRMKDGNPVGCVNPVLSMDVETPGSILHRRLASEIASSMRADVRGGIVTGRTSESQEWLLDQGTRVGAGEYPESTRDPLASVPEGVADKVRLILAACTLAGTNPFAPTGTKSGTVALSDAAGEFLAVAFGRTPSKKGKELAREDFWVLAANEALPIAQERGQVIASRRAERAMHARVARREGKR